MDSPIFRRRYCNNSPVVSRQTTSSAPKVVSIPVRFVQSGKNKSISALKIQKAFRGYLVRKSLNKIISIKREVDEIEKFISVKENVDSIKRDAKEKLKVNEALMSLLFKLDSVRGVDDVIRDFRKAVIKKAIKLQETLDDVVSTTDDAVAHADANSETLSEGTSPTDCANSENVIEDWEEIKQPRDEEEEIKDDNNKNDDDDGGRRKDESLVREENEKLRSLISELIEKNEIQTQLLTSLSNRVEQLERTLMCDRLRRKKKKSNVAAGVTRL